MLAESEYKIRDLFADPCRDQQLGGSDSTLHIVIFDKIDAVCKRSSGHVDDIRSNVEDSVTTQLLTEIDEVLRLDNIFLIGATNDIDSMHLALFGSPPIDITSR